jgi:hypothetical protein
MNGQSPYSAMEVTLMWSPAENSGMRLNDLLTGGEGGRPRLGSCKYLKSRAIHVLSTKCFFRRAVNFVTQQLFFRLRNV